jgi:hypothetical protein
MPSRSRATTAPPGSPRTLKPGKSFSAQVRAIRDAASSADACVAMQDFVNHVNAQTGKSLTAAQAAEILATAAQIKPSLGCGS